MFNLLFVLIWAATASAALPAPTVFCELAMTGSGDEASEALAESFRGLLEFGGELFTDAHLGQLLREDASSEMFFEPVPNSGQRSAALNSSLSVLGEWVALDAEDRGVDIQALRVRLQQVIRESRAQVAQERVDYEAAHEEQRDVSSLLRTELGRGDAASALSFAQAVSVGGGRKVLLMEGSRLLLLDLETQSITTLRAFEKDIHLLRRVSDDQVLVWFGKGDPMRILDLSTGREALVGISSISLIDIFPSPNGDWLLASGYFPGRAGESLALIEVATGKILKILERNVRDRAPVWSEDGDSFAVISEEEFEATATLNGYRRGVDAWGRTVFDQVYSMVFRSSISPKIRALGQGLSSTLIEDHGLAKFYRLTPQGLQLVLREGVTVYGTTFLRGDSEVVHVADGVVRIFDLTGTQTFDSIATNVEKGVLAAISPSQRYLLIQYGVKCVVVDLQGRRLMGQFATLEPAFWAKFSEDDSRLYLVARKGTSVFEYVLNLESFGMN